MGAVGVRISTYVFTEGSLLEQTVPQNNSNYLLRPGLSNV